MHRVEIPSWARERGRLTNHFATIDCSRTALRAVDMQNAFTQPGQVFGNPHACDIIPNVNRLAALVRLAGGRVVWTRQTLSRVAPYAYPEWQFDERIPKVKEAVASLGAGAFGHALNEMMNVCAGDEIIDKHRYSAFLPNSSDLDTRLRAQGADTLIIAGTLTNCCCDSSARDANMLGYKVLFASDATAAVTDEEHNAALLNLCLMFADVRTTAEIADFLLHSGRRHTRLRCGDETQLL